MAETSAPWNGTTVGDASIAPYDAMSEWASYWRSLTGAAGIPTNMGGVCPSELNELACTGTATPVSVNTGRALAYGTWYQSDAAVTVAIATPAVSTRIDRIVLRKSWAAQTVRITRIAGVEGGGAPALTQTAGVTWDTPLCQASITTSGVITVTDEREFLSRARMVDNTASDQVIANTIVETTIYTKTIAGGLLGRKGRLRVRLCAEVSNGSGGANGATVRLKLGGTTLAAVPTTISNGLTNASRWLDFDIINRNNVALQFNTGVVYQEGESVPVGAAVASTLSAVNTAADQALTLTWEFNGADPTVTATIRDVFVEVG